MDAGGVAGNRKAGSRTSIRLWRSDFKKAGHKALFFYCARSAYLSHWKISEKLKKLKKVAVFSSLWYSLIKLSEGFK